MPAIFNRNQRRESLEQAADTVINEGTSLTGDLKVEGSLRIEGRLQGTLMVNGILIVGPGAEIEAEISAVEARVGGRIRGNLKARESIELLPGSRLEGDVYTRCFRIEDGAYFQGNCFMGDAWVEEIRTA